MLVNEESRVQACLSAMTCAHGPLDLYLTKSAALGPDPLREDADAERLWRSMQSTRKAVGQVLMAQECVAGIGNIFRYQARAGRQWWRACDEGCVLVALLVGQGGDPVQGRRAPRAARQHGQSGRQPRTRRQSFSQSFTPQSGQQNCKRHVHPSKPRSEAHEVMNACVWCASGAEGGLRQDLVPLRTAAAEGYGQGSSTAFSYLRTPIS